MKFSIIPKCVHARNQEPLTSVANALRIEILGRHPSQPNIISEEQFINNIWFVI